MTTNYTWPGRLHIINNPQLAYFTLWVFGKRLHWAYKKMKNVEDELWEAWARASKPRPKGPNYTQRRKKRMYDDQNGYCAICGARMDQPEASLLAKDTSPTFDHIKRKREGGKNGVYNLRLVHKLCNEVRD